MNLTFTERLQDVRQNIMNFVGAHPRLMVFMAAFGISFTFAYVGKVAIHEMFQPAYAFPVASCAACAPEFAPGQEAEFPGEAHNFAPGQLKEDGSAEDFAPGQLKKKEIPS